MLDTGSHSRPYSPLPYVGAGTGEHDLRVFVLSDVRLYSDGLASLLAAERGIEVIGAGPLDEESVERVLAARPNVLLVDATDLRKSDVVRYLAQALPSLLIVACGVTEDPDEVVACAHSGAAGYVGRNASAEVLINTVRCLERGELPMSPRVASLLFRQLTTHSAAPEGSPAPQLTARERDVVALIDRGMSNKEIAAELHIEVTTVKNHVHHILEKLAVKRRSGVAASLRLRRAPMGVPPHR